MLGESEDSVWAIFKVKQFEQVQLTKQLLNAHA